MNTEGKAAYNRYHAEMGTPNAPAYERISNREQTAWAEASRGSCTHHCYQMQDDLQRLRNKVEELTSKILATPKKRGRPRKVVAS